MIADSVKYNFSSGVVSTVTYGANKVTQIRVQVGDWEHASTLMSRLAAAGMQPAAWGPLCGTLCDQVAREVEEVLAVLAPQVLHAVLHAHSLLITAGFDT